MTCCHKSDLVLVAHAPLVKISQLCQTAVLRRSRCGTPRFTYPPRAPKGRNAEGTVRTGGPPPREKTPL
eukprot:6574032-Pyramimonas_sp.AAC.1